MRPHEDDRASAEILFERRGTAGVVTLNRPQALNALSHAMVRALAQRLEAWAHDPAVTRVIVTAAGGRAFCAGGDIRALAELGRAGRQQEALAFWRDEYPLNARIRRYPKPYLSLIDGIVMGGGVGISVHGSHRVAGDRFVFAMPEVGIGFFPDVGGTWFLPRLPGEIGTWLALTAARIEAADAVAAGVATHRVASARFPELLDKLCGAEPVETVLMAFAEPAQPGPLAARRASIDRLFTGATVEEIMAALDEAGTGEGEEAAFARTQAAAIAGKSPVSLKIALAQVRRGRGWDFETCMRAEFRIVSRIVYGHDFYEGVRAVIVDKDNAPRWEPSTLAAVDAETVEHYFAPLGGDELFLS